MEPLHSVTKKNDQIAKALNKKHHKLKIDSQCKYTIVSRGQADAFIRLPTDRYYVEKIWDHAAGFLIATEAGAVVSDADGKVCFAQSLPILQAPKTNKRDAKLFVAFRPNDNSVDSVNGIV